MISGIILSCLVACAYCGVEPRAEPGVVDLSELVRASAIGQTAIQRIKDLTSKSLELPYSEIDLSSFPGIDMRPIQPQDHKCFYLRRMMKPETVTNDIDVHTNLDYESASDGHDSMFTITSSTAKIDTSRLGWTRDSSGEIGGSVGASASASAGIPGFFSAAANFVWNIFGSHRWSSSESGDSSKQSEFRDQISRTETCPKNKICSAVTWTYTQTIKGRCYLLPVVDTTCWDPDYHFYGLKSRPVTGNWSIVALFYENGKFDNVALQFFDITRNLASWEGKQYQNGVRMHTWNRVTKIKYEEDCSFTYPLRKPDGSPYRTQAVLSSPVKPIKSSVPKAVRLLEEGCELDDRQIFWSNSQGNWCKAPGSSEWKSWDLAIPEGYYEKCAKSASSSSTTSKRDVKGLDSDGQAATSVAMTFEARATTAVGESIKVVGNTPALGNWNPKHSVPMEATEDDASGSLWSGAVSLEAGEHVEYKYIKVLNDSDPAQCQFAWQAGSNNAYTAPQDDAATAVRTDGEVRFEEFIPCNFESQAVFARAVLEPEISDVEVAVLRDEVPEFLHQMQVEGYDGFVEP